MLRVRQRRIIIVIIAKTCGTPLRYDVLLLKSIIKPCPHYPILLTQSKSDSGRCSLSNQITTRLLFILLIVNRKLFKDTTFLGSGGTIILL